MDSLLARRHWIFDMDGTLTLAAHDFAAFKRDNGLPAHLPILEALADWPPEAAAAVQARLIAWEEDIARRTQVAEDALGLLAHLRQQGARLGILTRNTRRVAALTLQAAGLADFFAEADVLGRECAAPKPSPEGVLKLLAGWGAAAEDAVMVGDYLFDIEAGRAAGTATVLIDRDDEGFVWQDRADRVVRRLDGLLGSAQGGRTQSMGASPRD